MQSKVFICKQPLSQSSLESVLGRRVKIKWFHGDNLKITWFDTFESALLKKGFYLHWQRDILTLEQGRPEIPALSIGFKKMPHKLSSIPPGDLHNRLAALLSGRALLPILSINGTVSSFNFEDGDGKILAQGRLLEIPEQPSLIILRTIRGYDDEVDAIVRVLPAGQSAAHIHQAMFRLYHVQPTSYRSRPDLKLEATASMGLALYEILKANFEVMRQNEDGLLKDVDIEFLHDYRVAGRRMRSALSMIKGVLKGATNRALKDSLKKIGNYTGPLRDLDVYLLKYDDYGRLLPAEWDRDELDHFFRGLRAARTRALTRLRRFLVSAEYLDILRLWEKTFAGFSKYLKKEQQPVRPMASRLIHAQFNRLVTDGGQLQASSADEDFHELRIDAKKLRYLLEFFQSLYPGDRIDAAIKQLKALQDNLGAFNDLSVQIEFLEKKINEKKKRPDVKTLAAIIGALNYEKHLLRRAYGDLYSAFASEKNQNIYGVLFKEEPDEGDIIL